MGNFSPFTVEPLRYQPSMEAWEENEAETERELVDTLISIARTVHNDEGHAFRAVHAKSHGLLLAKFTVLDDLPTYLRQGLFAEPRSYPMAMRFSTVPGDLLDDNISTPRGLAMKIVGVEGERVAGAEATVTQDFVMVNGGTFSVPTARKFVGKIKLLAATTDKAPRLKKVFAAALRGLESLLEKAGTESPALKAMGGHPKTHVLGETYFSQVPILFGPYIAKLCVVPTSPALLALEDATVDLSGHPDGLREAVVEHFRTNGGIWELRVQLCTDLENMPIEDAGVTWPEEQSPFIAVARIEAGPQLAWSAARSSAVDDAMAFNPWHALAAHRPLGSIMRVRKAAYRAASEFRSAHNAVKVSEPTQLESLP